MNAIAGGGSFVSFPAMIAAGLPPAIANASSRLRCSEPSPAAAPLIGMISDQISGLRLGLWFRSILRRRGAWGRRCCCDPGAGVRCGAPTLLLLGQYADFAFGARAGLALRRVVDRSARLPVPCLGLDLRWLLRWCRRADDGSLEPADCERRPQGKWRRRGPKGQRGKMAPPCCGSSPLAVRPSADAHRQRVIGGYLGARLGAMVPARIIRGSESRP